MKIPLLSLILGIGFLQPLMTPAQGTVYLSNLGQAPIGYSVAASDAWLAGAFKTGSNTGGYSLNTVQLLMNTASGSPGGFSVSLYTFNNSNFHPGTNLGSLNGSEPVSGGLFTYSSSSIALSPSTFYFIVITAATPISVGSFGWTIANSASYTSSDGWILASGYDVSSDGLSWSLHRSTPLQFGVSATAIPEPATISLVAIGVLALGLCRRKTKRQEIESRV